MDALKALKAKMKQEKEQLAVGGGQAGTGAKRFVTKAELEAARIKKLQEEEQAERTRKDAKRKQQDTSVQETASKVLRQDKPAQQEQLLPQLSTDEVVRRLRALKQPATLFGEDDVDRLRRLLKSEQEVELEDENRGGQQENVLLELQRQEREKHRKKAADLAARQKAAADEEAAEAAAKGRLQAFHSAERPVSGPEAPAKEEVPEDPTMVAFERAASLLKEKREEEKMCLEDKIAKWVRRWVNEWEEDLDKRPESVRLSSSGYTSSMIFQQTQKYLEPLFDKLRAKQVHEELCVGLWMMVTAMRERNYQHASDIYLRLAIGNAPWPIGVTSVGIHERSAREKISHVMNASGQAHIMNDEATRKYLQAMKRLIGAVQRMYPTVPSRSTDFETTVDMGKGTAGAGSTKLALLQAEAHGETVEGLGLPDAPHFLEANGKVMVPPKWEHILAKAKESMGVGQPAVKNPPPTPGDRSLPGW